jgi:hypothetical protein
VSGFTDFLKKFGMDAVKVGEKLLGGPQVIVQELTQAGSDIKTLFDLIKRAERMVAAMKTAVPGSDKMAAILPDATATIGDIEILVGTRIASIVKDQAEFNAGVQDTMQGLVRILKACGD